MIGVRAGDTDAASRPNPEYSAAGDLHSMLAAAKDAMCRTGQWRPGQAMGRRWPVGCVALEITQRCNLDCTLCYLSETAEAVKDIPLAEVLRRIEAIHARYGTGTDIQVTGGDPTLRDPDELVAIVRAIADRGMRPSLFTNGIRATRPLLTRLAQAGLSDVAFHVDTTQNRRGYVTERELNAVRRDYIARAKGLGLHVIFNTTIHDGNRGEVQELVRWFLAHAGDVDFASFQIQAETGRGIQGARGDALTRDGLLADIDEAAGRPLGFGVLQAGHAACNAYAVALVAGRDAFPLADDPALFRNLLDRTAHIPVARRRPISVVVRFALWLAWHPRLAGQVIANIAGKVMKMGRSVLLARGRIRRISFFVHNFMDARQLDPERITACVFMVETTDGPVAMCAHNAERDRHVLKPVPVMTETGLAYWDPLTATIRDRAGMLLPPLALAPKHRKGRARKPAAQTIVG